MNFLLDGLHEDLNRVKVKPYTESVDYDISDEEVYSIKKIETCKEILGFIFR